MGRPYIDFQVKYLLCSDNSVIGSAHVIGPFQDDDSIDVFKKGYEAFFCKIGRVASKTIKVVEEDRIIHAMIFNQMYKSTIVSPYYVTDLIRKYSRLI